MGDSGTEFSREELSASLAARRELGQEYEPAVVDALAERVEQAIQARVEARLAERPPAASVVALSPGQRLAVISISLGAAIPCTAIAGALTGLPGVVAVWVGVALTNVAVALGPLRRP